MGKKEETSPKASSNSRPAAERSDSYTGPMPSTAKRGHFSRMAETQEEEDAFDFARFRGIAKPSGLVGSIAHLVKGALGGGILGGHVAFMKGGLAVAIFCTFFFGFYIGYSLYVLVKSAFVIYKRTRVPIMSYPDVGEAALAIFPNPKYAKFSKAFRYLIDFVICLDLFGACACYQIIIAKTIKQIYENSQIPSVEGLNGGPHLRVYLAIMIIPIILICFITHLKWLAPFSIVANIFIVICIGTTVYYFSKINPGFKNLEMSQSIYSTIEYLGMNVFSMSCAGVILPVCNNMKDPKKYKIVVVIGVAFIVVFVLIISVFGYAAYLDKCQSPITINFPLEPFPIALKAMIAGMIYITHALNFWVPFNLMFYYLSPLHNQARILFWELLYRAIFVVLIACLAIAFPRVDALMGFLGAFCLSFMAFIWPNMIDALVTYERPGYGKFKWRLIKSSILMAIGFFLLAVGTVVNFKELITG